MAEVWPSALPQNPSSVSSAPKSVVLSTKTSTGYPKLRRRYTKTYNIYDLTYEMDQEQFYEFELFFDYDLSWGLEEFLLPDPLKIEDEITVVIIQNEDSEPYSVTPLAGTDSWLVSFTAEQLK